MADPIKGIRAKLDRADEHLRTIENVAQRWSERDPCELVMDCDVQSHEHRFRLAIFESPPDDLNIPISECVHSLRSALDHIGYRLAVNVGGDPPPNETNSGFPICRDPTHFARSLPNKIGKPKAIPAAMRTALEAAQPYNGGDAANLPILENLHDCDKHRFPPLLAAVGEVLELHIGTFTGSALQGPLMGPLEHNAVVVRFTPDPLTEVDMNLRIRFDVAFGSGYPGDGRNVISFLTTTLDYIGASILPALTPFL